MQALQRVHTSRSIRLSCSHETSNAPRFKFDSDWPKLPLPNNWKMGGVTGLAVDKDDNVWVYDRPNDLRDMELKAELTPHIADCCTRPPSMIHIDKAAFDRMHAEDKMANDKLKEGIEGFTKAIVELEKSLEAKV